MALQVISPSPRVRPAPLRKIRKIKPDAAAANRRRPATDAISARVVPPTFALTRSTRSKTAASPPCATTERPVRSRMLLTPSNCREVRRRQWFIGARPFPTVSGFLKHFTKIHAGQTLGIDSEHLEQFRFLGSSIRRLHQTQIDHSHPTQQHRTQVKTHQN